MLRTSLLASVVVLALLGCQGKTRAVEPEAAARSSSADADAALGRASGAPAQRPDPIVDLLHTVDCTVAVSSKVDNPLDFPEHLVDGKMETAWNSRTGDLGGFIAFRVPTSARVMRVELTAGFDKVGPKGDLFTMNHRITKVRLSRGDGRVITEAALDPKSRAMQAISVDEPGGDFKLEILATIPGTEKRWRELTVSELRVWGRAGGAPENPSHLPKMAIGSLDGVRPQPPASKTLPPPGPFASVADLCQAYDKAMAPAINSAFPGNRYPGKVDGPHCRPLQKPDVAAAFTQGPFLGGSFAVLNDPEQEKARLILQTASGFSRTDIVLWSRYHDDPGCMHGSHHILEDARVVKTSTSQDVLVVRVVHKDVYSMSLDPNADPVTVVENAYACHIDDKGGVLCEGPLVTASAHHGLAGGLTYADERAYAIDVAQTPWRFRNEPVLGPAGDLRLGASMR